MNRAAPTTKNYPAQMSSVQRSKTLPHWLKKQGMKADKRNKETHVTVCSLPLRFWALHFRDKTPGNKQEGRMQAKRRSAGLPGNPDSQEASRGLTYLHLVVWVSQNVASFSLTV